MRRQTPFVAVLALVLGTAVPVVGTCGGQSGGGSPGTVTIRFDTEKPGTLPEGWTVAATHPGPALARWKVAADDHAPSPPGVLRVFPPAGNPGGTFNLCWNPGLRFQDGTIEVRLRADAGREDQGGGPAWRMTDPDNYYVARYNPLEHNFRLYRVRDGHRRMIATAEGIPIGAGTWFTIRIVHHADHIQCFLDGKKRIDVHDATFAAGGAVGLWTKADAATSFDDLVVQSAEGGR